MPSNEPTNPPAAPTPTEYYDGFWERFSTAAEHQHPANTYRYNLIGRAIRSLPHGSDCLLDLGCGNGSLIRHFVQEGIIFRRFVGLDTSKEIVARCAKAMPQFEFHHADLQEPLPAVWAGSADVVVCTEVVEHMEHFKPLLASAALALKPGGLFVLTTQGGKRRRHDIELLGHVRHYDLEALARNVEETGLKVESKRQCGFPILNLQKIAASMFLGRVRQELASSREPSALFRFACAVVGVGLKFSSQRSGPQLVIAARKP